jgi:uncharacterized hydrophobic protein (TIGR00271 family)
LADSLFDSIRARLSLRAGTDTEGTVRRVSQGASLTTENLWLLMCSAVLASIGLDTSSAPVIIGAMLISPLMGPILGVGLGVGVTDRHLLQRSLRELGVGTLISLAASTMYFLISPLATATPELLARTRPTLLDVGVAFFGGLAGIVAGSRRDITLALPGVAIATALMPPVCTAGFGFATGNWAFFFGALYLYVLNAIFIALATFLVVRLLRFPHHMEATPRERQIEHRVMTAVAIIATLPSMYFLYDAARGLREERHIGNFVQREIERSGRAVPQWEKQRDTSGVVLKVYVAGHPVGAVEADSLQAKLVTYNLEDMRLELVQSDISGEDLTRLEGQVQRGILRAVTAATAARDSATLLRARQDTVRLLAVAREVASAFPEIRAITYAPRIDLLAPDTAPSTSALLVTFAPRTSAATRRDIVNRAQALVRARLSPGTIAVMER